MTPDTSELILRSLTELRDEVREGLRKLDSVVMSLDTRVRDLELWRASQASADHLARDLVDLENQKQGVTFSKWQTWIGVGSMSVSSIGLIVALGLLVLTGHTQ